MNTYILALVLVYFILFTYLALKKFPLAVYLLILTIPSYLIRLNFGPLPSTLLEVSFFAVVIGFIRTFKKGDFKKLKQDIQNHKIFFGFLLGLIIFSLISTMTPMIGAENPIQKCIYALGEWRALFLEPIFLFVMLNLRRNSLEKQKIVLSLLGAAVFVAIIAIVQKFTGTLFPPSLWDDHLFGRVTSIFTSANAIGLFTVPIFFISLSLIKKNTWFVVLGGVLLLTANIFSVSQGAWIAIGAGILTYLFTLGYKKISVGIAIVGIVGALVIPSMKEAVLFQDKAGQNRLFVWLHTTEYLVLSPKNFLLGTGIRNFFDAIQKPVYNPKELEALKYPHNIVLNFWTEVGLFGMASIIGILFLLFICILGTKDTKIKAAYIAALVALVIHGLVDVPYFKNDLALLFWILSFLFFETHNFSNSRE